MMSVMLRHWTPAARVVSPRLTGPSPTDGGARPAALLRGEFTARAAVRSAQLRVTALGVYELELNGTVVGDHVLAPGGPVTATGTATRPSMSRP